jgi:hypothetical protein
MHNIFNKENVKLWDYETKRIIHNNNLAYTKYLKAKQLEDEINYKC